MKINGIDFLEIFLAILSFISIITIFLLMLCDGIFEFYFLPLGFFSIFYLLYFSLTNI